MGRISRQVMFMEMARVASRRSTCFRLNVGAIITYDNSPVSVGWNGAEAGAPHCEGNDCPGIVPGNCGTLHAESNALIKAVKILDSNHLFPVPVDMYATHSPCLACCDEIQTTRAVRVKRLFFEIPYRNTSHLGMFQAQENELPPAWITEVYEVTPAGYIVDYFSRRVVELP